MAALLLLAPSRATAEVVGNGDPLFGHRGIALSLHSQPTAADVATIAGWGANFVRLVVHADPEVKTYDGFYAADGRTFNEAAFARLDRLIDLLGARDIRVNLCLLDSPGRSPAGSGAILRIGGSWSGSGPRSRRATGTAARSSPSRS